MNRKIQMKILIFVIPACLFLYNNCSGKMASNQEALGSDISTDPPPPAETIPLEIDDTDTGNTGGNNGSSGNTG